MEELVTSTIDDIISDAEKDVIAEVVRWIQKVGLNGSKGNWVEFLNSDRRFCASLSDPLKRPLDDLVDFLRSFKQAKDLMFIGKMFRHIRDQRAFENHIINSLKEESPEQRLVRLTMQHPQYRRNYHFNSYDKHWLVMPQCNMSKPLRPSSMLSVDCEMVLCNDGSEAVVKVCVVDDKLKVKLEKTVNPYKAISNYRTEITGVSAEDLVGIKCSLVDIQRSMKKLLKDGTILIGHGLYNDLRALKIVHQRVIDTAYIFKCSGVLPSYTPSLNSLCKSVLGYEVRKEGAPHNCRNDAEAAMKLVLAKLEDESDDPIEIDRKAPDLSHTMLLHKVPVGVSCQELKKVFPQDLHIDIQVDLRIKGNYYSTRAIFKDAFEATDAYQRIQGEETKDSAGRPRKLVYLKLSVTGPLISFYVCKSMSYFQPEEPSKRQKISPSIKPTNQCKTPNSSAAEILRLKQELRERESEIFDLQRILADLTEHH